MGFRQKENQLEKTIGERKVYGFESLIPHPCIDIRNQKIPKSPEHTIKPIFADLNHFNP